MMGLPAFKKAIVITFIVGGIAGIVAALAAEEVDRLTTTDAFCTSCHAMQAYIAEAEAYKTSTHQTTASGVRPRCADCHIPKGLVIAAYTPRRQRHQRSLGPDAVRFLKTPKSGWPRESGSRMPRANGSATTTALPAGAVTRKPRSNRNASEASASTPRRVTPA